MTNKTQDTEADAKSKQLAADAAAAEKANAETAATLVAEQQAEADAKAEAERQAEAQAVLDAAEKAKVEEDAKAEAEQQAEAQAMLDAAEKAKVEEDAVAADGKVKAKAARKSKPVLDAGKLRELIAVVEAGNTKLQRLDLVARLELEEGASLEDNGATYGVTMAGITASATSGVQGALANWCNAARRKCLSGEAV
jgi:membrane protein involved in colicin uptake